MAGKGNDFDGIASARKTLREGERLGRGLSKIWRKVKVLATRASSPHTDMITDPDYLVIKELQDELIRSDIPPVIAEPILDLDETDWMN